MKNLDFYIFEEEDTKENDENIKERSDIKFTIWKSPDNKVTWLEDNEPYQKIEYKYINKKDGIKIDFLLGYEDGTWKLWVGKIGVCAYTDDPYCSLDTPKFYEAIINALDKIQEFIKKVKDDKDNWVQFYINL